MAVVVPKAESRAYRSFRCSWTGVRNSGAAHSVIAAIRSPACWLRRKSAARLPAHRCPLSATPRLDNGVRGVAIQDKELAFAAACASVQGALHCAACSMRCSHAGPQPAPGKQGPPHSQQLINIHSRLL